MMTATEKKRPASIVSAYEMDLRPHQAEELFDTEHPRLFQIGGLGSGKTAVDGLIVLDRSSFDTAQRGAIFANTAAQLTQAILPEVCKWLDRANIQYVYGKQAPATWRCRWKKFGIKTPTPMPKNFGALILDSGLHIVTGSLHGDNYLQFRSFEFGWAIVEEVTAGMKREALNYIIERIRCGLGADKCKAAGHRHQVYIHGNPPDQPDHWLYEYLEKLERKSYRLIQSSSFDNIEAIGAEYVDGLLAGMDKETADARIHGKLTRSKTGRAYHSFSEANKIPVAYDPARTLYLCFDFNVDPAVSVLCHPLRPGEYPSENERQGVEHVGVWGEFFHSGGMDSHTLAERLVTGEGGNFPSNWKGLREHQSPVIVYGDSTGRSRSMASAGNQSNWSIVTAVLRDALGRRLIMDVPNVNPLVHLSVRSLNAKLENAQGVRSLWVDPRCVELIRDFLSVIWSSDGTDIVKHNRTTSSADDRWKRSHESDSLRYCISRRFPAISQRRVPFIPLEPTGSQPGSLSSQLPSLGRGPWRGL